ncbi:MAG: HAMP domain-containing histidine kinase [Phycisphaerales bacterium]|nr:HAMP domain-containing histidine kinase [Phycisphaerales bacterium]
MKGVAVQVEVKDPPVAAREAELATLIESFNGAVAHLTATHEQLQGEVSRLKGELAGARSQLHRARELAALGEMAAGIAHEVRNPLGSIRLYAEALAQDLRDRPQERGVAERIVRCVSHLNAVVGDVLAFSREMVLEPEQQDAHELCEAAQELCAASAEGAEVTLRVPRSASQCFVVCDRGYVLQALGNVIRNACEAAGEAPGERIVEVRVVERPLRRADGSACDAVAFVVCDTGAGVSEAVRERMFNPFFTTRKAGTGLGLAIVHRIVDAHGGAVSIHNRADAEGGGAVVACDFPQAGPKAPTNVVGLGTVEARLAQDAQAQSVGGAAA